MVDNLCAPETPGNGALFDSGHIGSGKGQFGWVRLPLAVSTIPTGTLSVSLSSIHPSIHRILFDGFLIYEETMDENFKIL